MTLIPHLSLEYIRLLLYIGGFVLFLNTIMTNASVNATLSTGPVNVDVDFKVLVILGIVCVCGATENAVTISIFLKKKYRSNSANILLLNLGIGEYLSLDPNTINAKLFLDS